MAEDPMMVKFSYYLKQEVAFSLSNHLSYCVDKVVRIGFPFIFFP